MTGLVFLEYFETILLCLSKLLVMICLGLATCPSGNESLFLDKRGGGCACLGETVSNGPTCISRLIFLSGKDEQLIIQLRSLPIFRGG